MNAGTFLRIADFGFAALLLAVALISNSLSLIGLSLAGLALATRETLLVSLSRRLQGDSSRHFQYGPGKAVQAGNLGIALCTILAGVWLAGESFGVIVSGFNEITPFGFALVATSNALVALWHGILVYAHVAPDDQAKRILLSRRRRLFVLLVAVQIFLTTAVLAKDLEVAFWVDVLGAAVVSSIVVASALRQAWNCVCDLIDHPLDGEREAALMALLYREGIQPAELAELRTRCCGHQVFAEVTLRLLEPMPIEEAHQRLAGLRRALEGAVMDLDLVIKLQGPAPSTQTSGGS
ncbi:cation transporter [Pelagibius marinus]|uniref:cation transporter n=1 Tax=Pelagibius marinus TaxID=2762760 RepID=UPI00187338C0|nr:cation transporter [Pelagibius marinus]